MRAGLNGLGWIDTVLLTQRGHLFPWVPVMFAVGIGGYFSVPVEPGLTEYAALGSLGLLAAGAALRWPGGLGALAWGWLWLPRVSCLRDNAPAPWQARFSIGDITGRWRGAWWRWIAPHRTRFG